MNTKRLVADVSPELHAWVMNARYRTDESAQQYIRRLIREDKAKHDKQNKQKC